MPSKTSANISASKPNFLSLDTWAVIVAVALALAVKFDILKNVPW